MKELLEKEYSEMVVAQGGEAIKVEAFVVMGDTTADAEISVAEFGTAYRTGAGAEKNGKHRNAGNARCQYSCTRQAERK